MVECATEQVKSSGREKGVLCSVHNITSTGTSIRNADQFRARTSSSIEKAGSAADGQGSLDIFIPVVGV